MHKMKQKKQFVRPAILQELSLLPDTPILQASVVDDTTIVSTGQDVENYDFGTDQTYNHQWE